MADLLEVIGGDPGLWWETAAERLAAEFPMRHADVTAESVSAAARARGVPSRDVRLAARPLTGPTARGCREGRPSRGGAADEAAAHVPRWRGTR